MMSLALLMTFSTCDPFNKSVHIKPLFSLVHANLGNKRGHVMCVSGWVFTFLIFFMVEI